MSASQRKIEANRRNALKSTGPRTVEGKSRASRNAITHGLTALHTPIVADESQEAFDAFADELFRDLRPSGAMQRVIVDRIIFVSWKLRRIPQIERSTLLTGTNGAMTAFVPGPHPDLPPEEVAELEREMATWRDHDVPDTTSKKIKPKPSAGEAIAKTIEVDERKMRFLQMYEMRLERSLHTSLRELSRLKKMKNEATEENGDADSDEEEQDREVERVVSKPAATPSPEVEVDKTTATLRYTTGERATPTNGTLPESEIVVGDPHFQTGSPRQHNADPASYGD